MAELQIKVPPVGESISEVTIGTWFKNEGDAVKMDEVICGLDSDKATFELTAESDGVLHIKAQEGDTLAIGDLIAVIDTSGASNGATSNDSAPKEEPKPEPEMDTPVAKSEKAETDGAAQSKTSGVAPKVIEMTVPTVGESITEVTIASWNKKDGAQVELDEIICELESDKATFELPAESAGTLRIVAAEGDTLEIGAVICRIEVGSGAPASDASVANASTQPGEAEVPTVHQSEAEEFSGTSAHTSPVAAKILAEKGIDPSEVKGSGAGGRITKEDALNAQKSNGKAPAPQAAPAPKAPAASAPAKSPQAASDDRGQRREKTSSLRRTIARRLVAVKNETAMLTTFNEVDMKPIMDLRSQYKDKFKEKHEVGLGFMSFFTKAICTALQDFPVVNAYMDGDDVVYNDFCDVSIAVSSPRGLVVPVIRNAEKLSFAGIEKEIVRLATRARDGKLGIDEMTGGTFTITNGGIFGSMLSTPIINAPQSAILGMHNIVERPVALNGQVVIRPIMYVALSYDHRLIDGKDSVSFLVRVKQLLEDPARMLLEM
ncbi:2-oxoglutarate dehydrogenase complex dihydrolipoyllysine-residue succinyltransferase [Persicitalea jodogahamensis]|uniref:Dihydrolipoyllysine-residue succinyltransferase component of 2-oxoglutarate dehydrogenase complex n=1 Tax=Persicitalea jodogahamensis TaxID=402147 RepID=A0A8J3GAR9_9BACT|nr:2-oxoglutarate dehydrogenase complex dihydrolipoyllysine-residue succinyltransferase [Persicitalea jodogahamensis]GHB71901.1 dihydrolipoyllysine-residue succinyltransferase component of 2-oxoglutarate dehydrogenase complex [Persicitalea jodogahamensis]